MVDEEQATLHLHVCSHKRRQCARPPQAALECIPNTLRKGAAKQHMVLVCYSRDRTFHAQTHGKWHIHGSSTRHATHLREFAHQPCGGRHIT